MSSRFKRVGAVFVGGAALGAGGLESGVAEGLGDGDQVREKARILRQCRDPGL
jgi:hypothetical protein